MASTAFYDRPNRQRAAMYAVPAWKRREVARNCGTQYAGRDTDRLTAPLKTQAKKARRADDRRAAAEFLAA